MTNLERLLEKCYEQHSRILMRFDPKEKDEQWGIKIYPNHDDDDHFYAYHSDIYEAARMLLDELQGFKKW